jgi:prolyl-tRNA synthetase
MVSFDRKIDFIDYFTPKNSEKPEIHGGFASCHWCGSETCESKIKDALGVTIRCIPLDGRPEAGACIFCGAPSDMRVIFAKAY